MHRKSFKSVKDHSLIVDDGWFSTVYKDKIDDHLGTETEISFLKQPDSTDILLTNLYYLNMRQGTREQDDQQTVFKLSKENVIELRDYLNKVLQAREVVYKGKHANMARSWCNSGRPHYWHLQFTGAFLYSNKKS